MFTTVDKAIVAFVMGVIGILNVLGIHFGLSADTVGGIVAVVTPLLVYVFPNLPKDAP